MVSSASTKRARPKKAEHGAKAHANSAKRWVKRVTTDSTSPPPDLFTKDATTIARVMATKKVSPKGIGSAIRMVQYFLNRGGKNLSARRKRELEHAKALLHKRLVTGAR